MKLAADALFDYAVRALADRACSSGELRFKLKRRAASLSDIDSAITRLKDLGYLDDKRFAEMYALTRVENDGFGSSDPGKLSISASRVSFRIFSTS